MLFVVPPNGLVVYCGTIVTEEGKEKKVNIDFEPFKPINTSLYLCDNKFHTEVRTPPLQEPRSGHSLAVLEPQEQQEQALGRALAGLGLPEMRNACWKELRDCPAPPTPESV